MLYLSNNNRRLLHNVQYAVVLVKLEIQYCPPPVEIVELCNVFY